MDDFKTFGYADPPYPGQARKHYQCEEIDHRQLVAMLEGTFPDGWALSTSSVALWDVLPLCPRDTRVMAWVKPFASFKPGVPVAYAWEPILVKGGRKRAKTEPTVRDWVSANITLQKGVHGAKPEQFSFWLFEVMGMRPGDLFVDVFPGSGAVGDAFKKFVQMKSDTPVQVDMFSIG